MCDWAVATHHLASHSLTTLWVIEDQNVKLYSVLESSHLTQFLFCVCLSALYHIVLNLWHICINYKQVTRKKEHSYITMHPLLCEMISEFSWQIAFITNLKKVLNLYIYSVWRLSTTTKCPLFTWTGWNKPQKFENIFVAVITFFSLSSVQIIIIPACCLLCVL